MTKSQKKTTRRSSEHAGSGLRSWLVGGAVTIGLVLLIIVILAGTLNEPQDGVPEGTEEISPGAPAHVEAELYAEEEVPAGGEHSAVWANCGFYNSPIAAENAVHSLEHGAVWLTYRPGVPESDIEILRELGSPVEKVLVSPIQSQDSPIIATSWGFQLRLASADDPRLGQFIVEFAGSLGAPEPGGACTGGVGVPG